MRIFYVDDSGDEAIAILGAVTFEIDDWRLVLTEWLGWRKWMWKTYGLPADFELHAQEFVSGRGEISYRGPDGKDVHPRIDAVVGLRKEAYRRSLAQIERQEEISVLAVARQGATIADLYRLFVAELDELLADRNEETLLVVDGLDDSSYRPAHRALDLKARRVIEDPLMQSSRHSPVDPDGGSGGARRLSACCRRP
jgi:hypothetical protein